MPTYEYECDKCRRVFEVRQRISEPALTTCDACGGAVRRLLSPAPFILKGDGWYVTDYPSESRKKALQAEKGGAPATKSDAGSDKKADAGSDKKADAGSDKKADPGSDKTTTSSTSSDSTKATTSAAAATTASS
jgi:putative FmdB family regulatory protein